MSEPESMVERVARAIAIQLGDDLDNAFATKSEWTAARGKKGGRVRDINEPFRDDYLDAARAVIAVMAGCAPILGADVHIDPETWHAASRHGSLSTSGEA